MLILKLCATCGNQFVGEDYAIKTDCKECKAKEKQAGETLKKKIQHGRKRLRLFRVK